MIALHSNVTSHKVKQCMQETLERERDGYLGILWKLRVQYLTTYSWKMADIGSGIKTTSDLV